MLKNSNSKMHGLSEIGPNVPAFLIKLWKLVNDPETDELICWSESGLSFIINQPAQLARELLSVYYKHSNMASFIRQLNMYGFHKIVSDAGGLKNDNKYMEFGHKFFIRDHPYLLENIKRKLPNPKSGVITSEQFSNTNANGTQSEILTKILSDVNNLKGKQDSWDAKLAAMKRENEALWRELAICRQKHLKQEQIINRLIHFIVTIVQPSRNVSLRRRYPLMLNDIQPVKKITKLSGADTSHISQGSPTGPTIHEIDTTDVLFGSPDQAETSQGNEPEFMSTDITEPAPKFIEEQTKEFRVTGKELAGKSIQNAEAIPEDWLEIQMTEDDIIDPLTPIDPAKINPAVAAATLKNFEGANKITTPTVITIPSLTTTTESGKKNVTEKKVIYLTDLNNTEKSGKKILKKPIVAKLDTIKKSSSNSGNGLNMSSADILLDLISKDGKTSRKILKRPAAVPAKQKPNSSAPVKIVKATPAQKAPVKKADSKSCVPEIEIDDLEFLLTAKQPDGELAGSRGSETPKKMKTVESSEDPFLKLDSLYNGTISQDQLDVDSSKDDLDLDLVKGEKLDPEDEDRIAVSNLVSPTEKEGGESSENVLNFEPDSMAVVCQQPSSNESLARYDIPELSSHVDSVQGEIDYLKEVLKGEGYNFDANSLPWLFNDDPLSYGVLPTIEEEGNQKKNEEAEVSGNELMTYGASSLMDLVDMIGSPPSNQDWTNVLSPASPSVTDLSTPQSGSSFNFPSPTKRRKK